MRVEKATLKAKRFGRRGKAVKPTVFAAVLVCLTFPQIAAACSCPSEGLSCSFGSSVQCKLGVDNACSCHVVNHTCQFCGTCSLGRCSSCSCVSAAPSVRLRPWTKDSNLEVELQTFSPAMAQIVADLQKSAAQGHLCSSLLRARPYLLWETRELL
jgi:hypothetical protein